MEAAAPLTTIFPNKFHKLITSNRTSTTLPKESVGQDLPLTFLIQPLLLIKEEEMNSLISSWLLLSDNISALRIMHTSCFVYSCGIWRRKKNHITPTIAEKNQVVHAITVVDVSQWRAREEGHAGVVQWPPTFNKTYYFIVTRKSTEIYSFLKSTYINRFHRTLMRFVQLGFNDRTTHVHWTQLVC